MAKIIQSLKRPLQAFLMIVGMVIVVGVLVWQGVTAGGNPDPTLPHIGRNAAILNTALLVFREGLECIIVLAAITTSFVGGNQPYRRPVAVGVGFGSLATLATWFIVVAILSQINAPALDIQAATGLLAIIILLLVMNWFFHKIYWTGWISLHSRVRHELVAQGNAGRKGISGPFWGLVLLGFTSVYREGFEVVLFLQSIRLQVGTNTVLVGAGLGLILTMMIGILTFVGHHRLPYKNMLVLTGILLGGVLVVMVGESVQEMQLASWIGTTSLALPIPSWMGTWFAIFPNAEGLAAQFFSALLVIGSYFAAEYLRVWRPRSRGETPAQRATTVPTVKA
ncbi:MAG TPA: FTR1 family protein [Terriglobia bacterium]|nr:FTR1 family protein [Terriglobia bacterium]